MKPSRDDINTLYQVIEMLTDEEAQLLRTLPGGGGAVTVEKLAIDQLIAPRQATDILGSLVGKGIIKIVDTSVPQSNSPFESTYELSESGLSVRNLLRVLPQS